MGSACHLLVLLAGLANAHEYFPEKCPSFTPMQGFDWDQVTLSLYAALSKISSKISTAWSSFCNF